MKTLGSSLGYRVEMGNEAAFVVEQGFSTLLLIEQEPNNPLL